MPNPTQPMNEEELRKQLVCKECRGEGGFEGVGCSDCYGSGWWTKPDEAIKLFLADRDAAVRKAEGIAAYMEASTVLTEMAPLMVHRLEKGFPSMTGEVIGRVYAVVKKTLSENEKYMRSQSQPNAKEEQ